MTGIFASLRAFVGRENGGATGRSRDRANEESVVRRARSVGSDGTVDVPDRPTDAYHELGITPESLLETLIREAGGWTRQTDLVGQTEWSKSTVSRYLSAMEDDGRISRVPVGRTNVVGFPDALPERPRENGETGAPT